MISIVLSCLSFHIFSKSDILTLFLSLSIFSFFLVGRPLKLNEIVIQMLEKAYSLGMSPKLACDHASVSQSSYNTWMQRGEQDRYDNEETIFADLKGPELALFRSVWVFVRGHQGQKWRTKTAVTKCCQNCCLLD